MKSYAQQELEEAIKAITSTISKIEKVSEKETLGASQKTLIERRLKAFQIALELIEAKLKEIE